MPQNAQQARYQQPLPQGPPGPPNMRQYTGPGQNYPVISMMLQLICFRF